MTTCLFALAALQITNPLIHNFITGGMRASSFTNLILTQSFSLLLSGGSMFLAYKSVGKIFKNNLSKSIYDKLSHYKDTPIIGGLIREFDEYAKSENLGSYIGTKLDYYKNHSIAPVIIASLSSALIYNAASLSME